MASLLSVRVFETLCVGLWLWGGLWIWRQRTPVYIGVYFGSSTLMTFDWVFNSNWFFRVTYDEKFIPLWEIQGVAQPVALVCNYAFYFGVPVVMLVRSREWLDRRLGKGGGYAAVFLLGALVNLLFEIPMLRLGLWTYHQDPAFMIGGLPWSNLWYSGMLTVACYGAARLALKWSGSLLPATLAGVAGSVKVETELEVKLRGFIMGAVAIWSAFYLCLLVQIGWYAVTQPWVPAPRPF